MYCVYGNRHWSLVCIFITDTQMVVVRIDPISPTIDQDTQYILDHLKWATKRGPRSEICTNSEEDILIDITTPPAQDTQSCGLRVLQYHQIIGNTIAFFFLPKTQALSYQKSRKTGSKTHVALWPNTDTHTHASNDSLISAYACHSNDGT